MNNPRLQGMIQFLRTINRLHFIPPVYDEAIKEICQTVGRTQWEKSPIARNVHDVHILLAIVVLSKFPEFLCLIVSEYQG